MTGGSGVAFKTGWASYEAAQDVKQQMINRAARIWDIDPENVEYENGVIQHKSEPELRFTFQQLAARLNGTGGPIVGRANVSPTGVGGAYALHIADVAVDEDTGKVDILRYTAIQDAGTAIHPSYVEGQIQGGAVQGIGWALNEEYLLQRRRTHAELQLPGLPDAHVAGPAHDRHRGGGSAQPRASLRRARRGRGAHRAAHGRHRQRHPRRHGRPNAVNLPMNPGAVLEALWEQNGG